MKTRVALMVCLVVVLVGYAASDKIVGSLSHSPELQITPPSPALEHKIAAFSGSWEAIQPGVGLHRVVVERINETWASILVLWHDRPAGHPNGGWTRGTARVLPHGELRWGYPVKYSLKINPDGATLEGKIERFGATATTTLRKVGAS